MRNILLLIFLFTAHVYAAPMGQKDKISNSCTVKNDFWSCSFVEGAMFPGKFVFADGTKAGAILFRDTAVFQKQEFALFEERRAKSKIIANTENEFIIELHGTFWRNVSPLIKCIDNLKVICRYEFKRNSPDIKMIFKYDLSNDSNITFENFFNIIWYYEHPFTYASVNKKDYKLEKGLSLADPQQVILKNDKFSVKLQTADAFVKIPQRKTVIACSIGSKNNLKNSTEMTFEKSAVFTLLK